MDPILNNEYVHCKGFFWSKRRQQIKCQTNRFIFKWAIISIFRDYSSQKCNAHFYIVTYNHMKTNYVFTNWKKNQHVKCRQRIGCQTHEINLIAIIPFQTKFITITTTHNIHEKWYTPPLQEPQSMRTSMVGQNQSTTPGRGQQLPCDVDMYIPCQDNDKHWNTPHWNIKMSNKMYHQHICDTIYFDKSTKLSHQSVLYIYMWQTYVRVLEVYVYIVCYSFFMTGCIILHMILHIFIWLYM